MHTCIRAYIQTCMSLSLQDIEIRTNIRKCIHAYIHTGMSLSLSWISKPDLLYGTAAAAISASRPKKLAYYSVKITKDEATTPVDFSQDFRKFSYGDFPLPAAGAGGNLDPAGVCLGVCMCACVCIHIHTYIRIYIHTYVYTYIHTYIHTYIYRRGKFDPVCVGVCVYVCMYEHLLDFPAYVYLYKYIYTYIHACMHICADVVRWVLKAVPRKDLESVV